ncbi:MAG: hypothetical protein K6A78_10505 [Prevotella sp.]|nr:hypothetical protein [Prevotella sp.]
MKKRRSAREVQKRRRQESRRFPFNENTELRELVDKALYPDLSLTLSRLSPFLLTGERGLYGLRRLDFDLQKLEGCRQFVIKELAHFLKLAKDRNGLRCSQLVFFRYLSSKEHCNLEISENSLKALITKAIQEIF